MKTKMVVTILDAGALNDVCLTGKQTRTKVRKTSSLHWHLIKKPLLLFKSTINSCWGTYTGFIQKSRYKIKPESVCRCICVHIPKDFSEWCCLIPCLFNFGFNTALSKGGWASFVHFTQIIFMLPVPGRLSVAEDGAYLLSLVPLLGLRQILCLGW